MGILTECEAVTQPRDAQAKGRSPLYRQLYVQVLTAIAPVIFLTVATGIAGMNDMHKVDSVAGKAFAYFLSFSTLALIIGLAVGNIVQPGAGLAIAPATLDAESVAAYTQTADKQSLAGFVLDIIPEICDQIAVRMPPGATGSAIWRSPPKSVGLQIAPALPLWRPY